MLFFPGSDLFPPGLAGFALLRRFGFLEIGQYLVQFVEHALYVTHDGDVGVAVLADFGGVDVDVDYTGVRREGGEAAGYAVVESDAQSDKQIGVGDAHVGGVTAVHAGHADEVRMLRREPAQAHKGADCGAVEDFHQFLELRRGFACDDAAAGVDERAFGFPHHLRGAADLPAVAFGEDPVAGEMDRRDRLIGGHGLEDVLRDVDQHWAGTSGGSDVERLMDGLGQFADVLDHEVVLGGGAGDAEGVGFLERVGADQLAGDLAGEGDDGDGIHHRVHQTGHEVGGPGTGGGAADTYAAGGPGVALRCESRILFVTDQYVVQRMVVECVIKGERYTAGIAEDAVHAFANQTFQQHFGATD